MIIGFKYKLELQVLFHAIQVEVVQVYLLEVRYGSSYKSLPH